MRKILFLIAAFTILVLVAVAGPVQRPPGDQVCQASLQVELISIADVPSMLPALYVYSSPEAGTTAFNSYTIARERPGYAIPETGSAGGMANWCTYNLLTLKNAPSFLEYVYIGNLNYDRNVKMNSVPAWLFTCNLKFPLLL